MKAKEAMRSKVFFARPDQTIREAAHAMLEIDAGFLPVGENDRLVGMVTDRDIAVRGVALGKGPDTLVRDVMTHDVKYCFEDENVEDIARSMSAQQVRRLPVLNRDKRLVGVISIGDMASCGETIASGEALSAIAKPTGLHSQRHASLG